MGESFTRRLPVAPKDGFFEFHARCRSSLVMVTGGAAGNEYPIERPRVSLGRGPGVDLEFNDGAMSREHCVIEFAGEGFRVRDLGSTNGTRVNSGSVQSADLKNGDRLELGEHVFQLVLEERPREPRTYVVPDA